MKKLLILFFTCLTMTVQAVTILWADVNQDAVITDSNSTICVNEFYGNNLENALFRIKILDDTYPDFIYPDFPGERFPGEWGDFFMDGPNGSDRKYVVWAHQFELPDDISNDSQLVMELGILDENDNFEFIAISDIFYFSDIKNGCTYETTGIEALAPPSDFEFSPVIFYTDFPVPEPSIAILMILGACILLLKRKNYERT